MRGPPQRATIHTLQGQMVDGVLHLVGAKKRRINKIKAYDGIVRPEKPPVVTRKQPRWRTPG